MEKKERLGRGLEDFSDLFRSSTEAKKQDVCSPVIEADAGKNLIKSITTMGNRVQKMRLRATYGKDINGFIISTIKVLHQGDFPTPNIFRSTSDTPGDETWNLGGGTGNTVSKNLATPDEAKQWVSTQIKCLKTKLDRWRSIPVPDPEEFEV